MITQDIGIVIGFESDVLKSGVSHVLSNMGFRNVSECSKESPGTGLQECELLITDVDLRTPSSVNFIMTLKNNIYPKRLPVLLASRETSKEYYLSAFSTGLIDECIVYPFTAVAFKKKMFGCLFKAITERLPILIVDDAAPMRNSIRFTLTQIGFKDIDTAVSGEDAMTSLQLKDYGLVITDLNMPRMTGIELVEAMKKDEKMREIPVLVLTAENDKNQVLALIKAGVSGYVLKPYTFESLQEKIMGLSSHLL